MNAGQEVTRRVAPPATLGPADAKPATDADPMTPVELGQRSHAELVELVLQLQAQLKELKLCTCRERDSCSGMPEEVYERSSRLSDNTIFEQLMDLVKDHPTQPASSKGGLPQRYKPVSSGSATLRRRGSRLQAKHRPSSSDKVQMRRPSPTIQNYGIPSAGKRHSYGRLRQSVTRCKLDSPRTPRRSGSYSPASLTQLSAPLPAQPALTQATSPMLAAHALTAAKQTSFEHSSPRRISAGAQAPLPPFNTQAWLAATTAASNVSLLSEPPAASPTRPVSRMGHYSQAGSLASLQSDDATVSMPPARRSGILLLSAAAGESNDSETSSLRSTFTEMLMTKPKHRRTLPLVPQENKFKRQYKSEFIRSNSVRQRAQYNTEKHIKAIRTIQLCYRQYRMRKQFAEARTSVRRRSERRQSMGTNRSDERQRLSMDRLHRFSCSLDAELTSAIVEENSQGQIKEDQQTKEDQDETLGPTLQTEEEMSYPLNDLEQTMRRLRCLTNAEPSYACYLNMSNLEGMPGHSIDSSDESFTWPIKAETAMGDNTQLGDKSPQRLASTSFKEDVVAVETQRLHRLGVCRFNDSPDKGISFLVERHLLASNPRDIARFLHTEETLNRTKIGEYLGGTSVRHLEVLDQYVNLFHFSNMEFDNALRFFLTSFRLPGEAQKIERILEVFAMNYHRVNSRVFLHSDTPFILAFSLVMLNTDSHNPANKRKMTKEQFVQNNSGIDDGDDLPRDLLERVGGQQSVWEASMNKTEK